MAAVMSLLSVATEDERVALARSELARVLASGARDAVRGELDEVFAAVRRVCDEQERAIAGTRRRGKTWTQSVEEVYRRAGDPWVGIRLGSIELLNIRVGSYIAIIGPEGGGKSSFSLQILAQHERDVGPAIYVTPELDHDEGVARVIGQDRGASWREVLTGQVPRDQVAERQRWRVLEREDATVRALEEEVLALREEFGDLPILVAWDYLQADPGAGEGERLRIAKLSSDLRRLAKRLGIVIIGISQSSRAGAKQLESGELIGKEASRTGAESAQIERDAYATISLGDRHVREDGDEDRSVSLGKYRMGAGDMVFKAIYCGRTGYWRIEEEAKTADSVRAEREGRDESARVHAAELAMSAHASKAEGPVTREDLIAIAQTKSSYGRSAIANLLASGELVEVARRKPRAKYYMIWTREAANKAGIPIVADEVSE